MISKASSNKPFTQSIQISISKRTNNPVLIFGFIKNAFIL